MRASIESTHTQGFFDTGVIFPSIFSTFQFLFKVLAVYFWVICHLLMTITNNETLYSQTFHQRVRKRRTIFELELKLLDLRI